MENLSDYEKVLQVIDAKGIKIQEAESRCGLGLTTLQKLKTRNEGKGRLHPNNLEKFLRTFHVKQHWWETGEGEMFEVEQEKNKPVDIQHVLLESLKGINKLLDENGKLINDKRKEVESLERVNTWALSQIDKLTSKLGVPKEPQ